MERSITQLHRDIFSMKYNFEKSRELAPIGYRWVGNHDMSTDGQFKPDIDTYKSRGCVVLNEAYNMYGEPLENCVGIYEKL